MLSVFKSKEREVDIEFAINLLTSRSNDIISKMIQPIDKESSSIVPRGHIINDYSYTGEALLHLTTPSETYEDIIGQGNAIQILREWSRKIILILSLFVNTDFFM
jgi:hypothetical protein